jgi:hypothetical protein
MCRVHQDYGHTGQSCLVLNEAAELGERPASHLCPLRLPERSPTLTNTFKIFEGNVIMLVFFASFEEKSCCTSRATSNAPAA